MGRCCTRHPRALIAKGVPVTDQFYLQDSRQIVGNDMMWWALGGGYTSDVSKAEVFTRDEAQRQHNRRETDVPWPKAYIDAKTRPVVDFQYVSREDALKEAGSHD